MSRCLSLWLRVVLIILANMIFGAAARADYTVTDLNPSDVTVTVANGINNKGQVVGVFGKTLLNGRQLSHPFLWSNGVFLDLESSQFVIWGATAISDNGQVIGSDGRVWNSGVSTILELPDGAVSCEPLSISPSGAWIVGSCSGWFSAEAQQFFQHAVVWLNGSAIDLGTFGALNAGAFSVNDAGQVVGNAGTHGFLWSSGALFNFGENTSPVSINAAGHVTGEIVVPVDGTGQITRHAFFYRDGVISDLGVPPGEGSARGRSINDKDVLLVVAPLGTYVYDGTWNKLPIILQNTRPAINNKGQISGTSFISQTGQSHAFLLTPNEGSCSVQVTPLSQGDLPWGPQPYDTRPGRTIGQLGCALTALSMALNFVGVANDPLTLNNFMTATDDDYLGGFVSWGAAARDASNPGSPFSKPKQMRFDNLGGAKYSRDDSILNPTGAFKQVNDALCSADSHPVIVGVPGIRGCSTTGGLPSPNTPGHFVLITGRQVDSNGIPHYSIIDPGCRTNTSMDAFNNEFVTRGVVKDPPGDISELDIAVDGSADLLVSDPGGNLTGHDASLGTITQAIAGSAYFSDRLDNDETGEPGTDTVRQVPIFSPSVGTFNIQVNGTKLSPYSLSVRAFSQDGSAQPFIVLRGIGAPGSTSQYQIQFVSSPGSVSTGGVFATFQGTMSDISNSLQLGLIDNKGTANSLSQKIDAAQKQTGPARLNILNVFINEVNALAGKHVNGPAVDVLLQDASSLARQSGG